MAIELEKIKSWDGQSGTGADNRGVIDRNFEKVAEELDTTNEHLAQIKGGSEKSIKDVENEIGQLAGISKLDISGAYENGGIFDNGSVFESTTIEKTGFIKLKAGDKIAYTGQRPDGLAAVNLYSSNNYSSFVSSLLSTGKNYTSYEITIPSDGFIVASSRKVGESGNTLKLQVVDNKFPGKFAVENRDLIHEIESRANYIDDKITTIDITGSLVTGAIMSDGTINTGVTTSESTDYLSVREGDVFLYSGMTGSGTCNVAGYDLDKNFIEPILANADTAYNREAFTIPSGVFFIKASSRKVGQGSNIIKIKIENYDEYQLSENYKRVSDIHNRLLKIEEGSIYEYSNFIDGKTINESGDIIPLSTCEITEFIDVIEGAKFIYTSEIGSQVIPVAGYDENEQFVQPVVTGQNKVFDNYEFTIPAGISKIVAMSRNASGSVSGTTLSISQIIKSKNIKSELEALKDYVDLIGYKPAIVIEPVATDTVSSRFYRKFNVYSLVSNLNEYVKHEFIEVWNRTTNADRGWYCPNIKFRDETIAHGEFNWIHMLDSTVAGFESESGHVGVTHGCEIFEREVFLLDGKEFTPGDPSFTTMHGDCFTMLSESTIYAGDRLSAVNGDNNVFKLDVNDNPIPSTKHWMHVRIEVNNKLYLRNKLKVLRDNTKFVQCHIGMLSCAPLYFQYEQIKNSNWDISYYPFLSTDTERQAGQAISPSTEVIGSGSLTNPLSNESVKWGENQGVNYQMKCNFKMLDPKYNGKENHIFMRKLTTNKTYMQPVLTTAFSVPDVFMGGDILEGEVFTEINIK